MALPNHKAGLAVVVPTSENRSPTQRKSKQHVMTVPRNKMSQFNWNTSPRAMSNCTTPRQPNGALLPRQTTEEAPFQPSNGTLLNQPRLLSVDEALQFSPFSSIVPFGPGESYCSFNKVTPDSSRYHTNTKRQPPWLSNYVFLLE